MGQVRGDVHRAGEQAQGLVEVVQLREDAHRRNDDEDVRAGVDKLVLPGEGDLYRNSEGLAAQHCEGTDCAADGDVDERVLFAIFRRDLVYHD